MGTSSLYGGPKRSSLLPSDYSPEENYAPEADSVDPPIEAGQQSEDHEDGVAIQDNPVIENPENQAINQILQPSVTWGTARSSVRRAMSNRSERNVKRAIRDYTKALGGHSNATRQAVKARKAAISLYAYFAGTPSDVRQRFEDAGIKFDARPTKDIFNDICNLVAPIPNDIDDSLINKSLRETFAEVAADQSIDLNLLDCFDEKLLQRLVGGLIKHYIYDKLIMQSEQTALNKCDNTSNLRELEKSIKLYIDGIVDSVIEDVVKSGLNPTDFNRAIETLFDVTYQQMEDMQ